MTSTVWPNRRQGIITMLSGGAVGQYHEPAQIRLGTKVKDASGAERCNSRVFTFSRILGTLGTPTRPSYVFLRV